MKPDMATLTQQNKIVQRILSAIGYSLNVVNMYLLAFSLTQKATPSLPLQNECTKFNGDLTAGSPTRKMSFVVGVKHVFALPFYEARFATERAQPQNWRNHFFFPAFSAYPSNAVVHWIVRPLQVIAFVLRPAISLGLLVKRLNTFLPLLRRKSGHLHSGCFCLRSSRNAQFVHPSCDSYSARPVLLRDFQYGEPLFPMQISQSIGKRAACSFGQFVLQVLRIFGRRAMKLFAGHECFSYDKQSPARLVVSQLAEGRGRRPDTQGFIYMKHKSDLTTLSACSIPIRRSCVNDPVE